eukprot:690779-Prymnesium_polylepis.2
MSMSILKKAKNLRVFSVFSLKGMPNVETSPRNWRKLSEISHDSALVIKTAMKGKVTRMAIIAPKKERNMELPHATHLPWERPYWHDSPLQPPRPHLDATDAFGRLNPPGQSHPVELTERSPERHSPEFGHSWNVGMLPPASKRSIEYPGFATGGRLLPRHVAPSGQRVHVFIARASSVYPWGMSEKEANELGAKNPGLHEH